MMKYIINSLLIIHHSIMEMIYNNGIILILFVLPISVAALTVSKPSKNFEDSLRGKSVILTGASSGLGKALAFQLAKCNVNKLILSGRNITQLDDVKLKCEQIMLGCGSNNNDVQVVPCDLADEASVDKFSNEAMSKCDENVDVLILCGGISSRSSFLETTKDVDKMLMQVNFLSGSAISKQVIPSMVQKKKGNIIWISSVQGLLGTPYRTSYAASKFAVQGYCEALRAELTESGVHVSCVSPGYIKTNLSKGAIRGDGSMHGKMDETTAKGAEPDAIAREILNAVIIEKKTDFIVAATFSAKVALLLRFFAPSLLEKILVKRYKKGQ